ncbi:glycosyltransferase family 2 protein [Bizionia argentinensis JUB59]|uniref:Glycosyltransferase family 2 protein n=1 Tax=Bizionia argentinensis JUB59 TaxID=1046627 RepID=G2EBW7_9FLAO|nr:glycosyltransferase family 2 protein [Bizionia argentinensis]EGV44118.1 glycosyltransferase family 2 protein [Bizionia argentinensis JUB59]
MAANNTTLKKPHTNTRIKAQKLKHFLGFTTHSNGKTESSYNGIALLSTLIFIAMGVYLFTVFHNDFQQFNADRKSSIIGLTFLVTAGGLFAFKTFYFIFMAYKYFKYKPIESVSDDKLPTVTIIVPAYNEGKQVWDTLMSLANSAYPKGKIQLLAIDDGSLDDTWDWMVNAKKRLGDGVEIFKQPENKGKRHALYRGFNLGTGEVFVTVDSDSVVTPETLRNLVSPFITDKNCGAVAGNIRVLNNTKAMLPKMLDVSFVMSFEFVRSAESAMNSVLCTPGALAAYRSEAVFACLPEWINQTFMGQPSDIGEDRAMTNMILKQGKHVLFQRNAVAFTNVPEEYPGLYKMFIRWGRSNVRENINMAKYVFTNFKKENKFGTRLLFISQSTSIIMSYPFVIFMLFFVVTHPLLFLGSTLLSILVTSTFSVFFFAHRYEIKASFWAYTYSILYTFGLFWITPYAIATASRRGWLTRGLAEKK